MLSRKHRVRYFHQHYRDHSVVYIALHKPEKKPHTKTHAEALIYMMGLQELEPWSQLFMCTELIKHYNRSRLKIRSVIKSQYYFLWTSEIKGNEVNRPLLI